MERQLISDQIKQMFADAYPNGLTAVEIRGQLPKVKHKTVSQFLYNHKSDGTLVHDMASQVYTLRTAPESYNQQLLEQRQQEEQEEPEPGQPEPETAPEGEKKPDCQALLDQSRMEPASEPWTDKKDSHPALDNIPTIGLAKPQKPAIDVTVVDATGESDLDTQLVAVKEQLNPQPVKIRRLDNKVKVLRFLAQQIEQPAVSDELTDTADQLVEISS